MHNECWGVILAAGQGSRMARATGGEAKQFLPYRGVPLWWHPARALAASPRLHGLVFVFPAGRLEQARKEALALNRRESLGVPMLFAEGGERRQDSVRHALAVLPDTCRTVLIHDGARPFVTPKTVEDCISSVYEFGSGIAANRITDTVKACEGDFIDRTVNREKLRTVQTPQGFYLKDIRDAYAQVSDESLFDDSEVYERAGKRPHLFYADRANLKITYPEDLKAFERTLRSSEELRADDGMRTGFGHDIHAFARGRKLLLAGVEIPYSMGLEGHSDADVLVHSVMDALLSAAGLRDIGCYFPNTDPRYKNISSMKLLDKVLFLIFERGYAPVNVAVSVICEQPKLADHIPDMRRNLAAALGLPEDSVGISAGTNEKLGFLGEGKGICALCQCLIKKCIF